MPDNALAPLYPQYKPPPDAMEGVARAVALTDAIQKIGLIQRQFPALAEEPAARLRGLQIANDTAMFEQRQKQRDYLLNGLGALADKPNVTKDDVFDWVTTGARTTGIPGAMWTHLLQNLPSDPTQLRSHLTMARNEAIGVTNASGRVTGPPGEGGAPTTMSLGQANYASGGTQPGITTGLPPGAGEAQRIEAESGQEAARGLQNAANEIPTQRTQLDLMRNDLKQAESKFGPTAKYEKVANVVAGRVLGFHPTMSKEEIAALDSFDKVARQIALSQAGSLHATDQTLHTALGANPNTDLSALGNENIINMLHGNADAVAAKAREWNKARRAGTGADKFYQWSDQFNQSFDPRVFQFMRMDDKGRATLLRNIPDKIAFEKRLAEADRKGWITLPK
jgi:hypothetical protein